MVPKYQIIKRLAVVVPLFFFSILLRGQYRDSILPLEELSDTLVQNPPEEEIEEEDTYDDPPVTISDYFLQKENQQSGGPDSLQLKKLPDSLIQKLKNDNDFWYVNYIFEKDKKQEAKSVKNQPFTERPFFQTMLWLVIIAGFAAFVIIYLSNSNVGLFRKKSRSIGIEEEMPVETDNIFEINYSREIDKAVSLGNFRFAVRLMFLRLLKNLANRKMIDYKPDSTDFDYLLQISPTKYYHDFFRLTRNYEYSWYGQFDIDPEKFTLIRKDFENFESKLK